MEEGAAALELGDAIDSELPASGVRLGGADAEVGAVDADGVGVGLGDAELDEQLAVRAKEAQPTMLPRCA